MEFWFFVVAVIGIGYGTTLLTQARLARGPETSSLSAGQAMRDSTDRAAEAE
jgi:hypothetical protein